MNESRGRWAALLAVGLVAGSGCASHHPPASTQPAATQAADTDSPPVASRLRDLSQLSDDYAALAQQLPGRNTVEHARLMTQVFDKLEQILSILSDPRKNLVYRQQIAAVDEARSTLGSSPSELVVEPTVDSGLRSAYAAFQTVISGKDFADTDFSTAMNAMRQKLDELDTVRGLTHQVIVGEVVDASSAVVNQLSAHLASMLVTQASTDPTRGPTSTPASGPSSAPATSPAATAPTPPAPGAADTSVPPSDKPAAPPTAKPAAADKSDAPAPPDKSASPAPGDKSASPDPADKSASPAPTPTPPEPAPNSPTPPPAPDNK